MLIEQARRHFNESIRNGSDSRLRLQTIVRLRWFAVAGQLVTVAIVYGYLGFALPLGVCLLLIAVSAWLNVFLRMRFPATHRLSPAFATALLAYDVLQLGALLFMTGGIDNPFTVLIVAPVTVSAATLPTRNTLLLGAIALFVSVILAIWHMPLPWTSPEGFDLPVVYKIGVLASVTACLTFLALYAWRLAKEAREMTTALA
ncbi:MAG: sensor histidine kinase, partial [Pseudomonadota bacterium]